MTKTSHDFDGDRVLVTVHEETLPAITLDAERWRAVARAALKECNAAERRVDPDVLVNRINSALGDAVVQAATAESEDVARMRVSSNVLHRLADMVQAGTIQSYTIRWAAKMGCEVILAYSTLARHVTVTLELGRGAVAEHREPRGGL